MSESKNLFMTFQEKDVLKDLLEANAILSFNKKGIVQMKGLKFVDMSYKLIKKDS